MKKIILTALILILLKNSYSQINNDGKYYGYHYSAGFIMGGIVGMVHKSPKTAFISSVTTGVGVGFAKEIYDYKFNSHTFSKQDFLYTVLGSLTSGAIVYGIKKIKSRKKTLSHLTSQRYHI